MSDQRGQTQPGQTRPGDQTRPDQTRPDAAADREGDGLLSRLRVIEDQPLESRAEALGHLHDELRTRLESDDPSRG